MRLEGKTALITGGGSGIGRAISERFALEGATVVVVDLRLERARETAEAIASAGGTAVALGADVGEKESVNGMAAAALESQGRIDVLVNNAGICSVHNAKHDHKWVLNLRRHIKKRAGE